MSPNSLAFRLLSTTALWMVVALLVTGLILSAGFRQNAEREFERLLLAHTYNLMGSFDVNADGVVTGTPNLGDPRFLTPLSGWYWSVAVASDASLPILHSQSISGDPIELVPLQKVPFSSEFRRSYQVPGENGDQIQRLEAQLYLGEGDTLYQVLVAGSKSDVEAAVSRFNRLIMVYFTLFGIGTIIATFFVIRFGLKPLHLATEALLDVREGRAESLQGRYPWEIQPLANEINALIGANKSIVERARTQVGNLAHGLKTPLAVIQNEIRKPTRKTQSVIGEQADLMKSQVQTYLDRARIAAQREVINSRTNVSEVLERLIRVMNKLNPTVEFTLTEKHTGLEFRGEQQDLEEILGNLLENASRFARASVQVSVSLPKSTEHAGFLQIEIADDGPGLSEEQRTKALQRGIRLDESKPGSGLGLSIVRDIATEYKGAFNLGTSSSGGLSATIILPRAVAKGRDKN